VPHPTGSRADIRDICGLLGEDWATLDSEGRYFKLVTKANMQGVLKEVGEL